LKKKYQIFKALCDNSGFGWDSNSSLPTAVPQVWEDYLNAHKEAKEFQFKTLLNMLF
jgi:hypothetical protein